MKIKHILLVEDNEGDIVLTREALEDVKIDIKLSVVRDGKEAIDFVAREGKFRDEVMPDILLLDINLPKKNGHEVLRFVKENEMLKHIPVIMLTTSSSEKDINLAYDNHANCFITKPVDVNDFLQAVATIVTFWISIAILPVKKSNTYR